jgi:hypothetical protein
METKTHAPGRLEVRASRSPLHGVSSIFYDNHVFGAEDVPRLSELQEREPRHYTLKELHARCNARKTDENIAKEWIDKLLTGTSLTCTSQASRPSPPSLATKFETLKPSSALPVVMFLLAKTQKCSVCFSMWFLKYFALSLVRKRILLRDVLFQV